ncbi:Trm112 family protein [Mycobacterium sp. BMJ-28]
MVDSKLLSILVCPEDRGPLLYVAGECLYNPRLRRAYRIVEDIPVLLIDEAVAVSEDAEHDRLVSSGSATPR